MARAKRCHVLSSQFLVQHVVYGRCLGFYLGSVYDQNPNRYLRRFYFFCRFFIELPSGVLADLIGRRKAILFGNTLLFIGNLFIAFSSSFLGITLWYLVWTIGYAFQSGATEALAYDSVKKIGREDLWPKVNATSTIVGRTTSLTATALGGLLYVDQLFSHFINSHTRAEHRATVLSAIALLIRAPYIVLALLTGLSAIDCTASLKPPPPKPKAFVSYF
jgi:MFS family permease